MSERVLRNQADKYRLDPLVTPLRTPILLSDSKGLRLRSQVRVNPESLIEFWCEPGATATNRLEYLKQHLPSELARVRHSGQRNLVTIFVWVGTCDLTVKQGSYIYLKSNTNSAVFALCQTLKDIYHYCREFGQAVKLVFLQFPVISIYRYNYFHNYGNGVWKFRQDDIVLHSQIDNVNRYINDLNRVLHVDSPKFSEDLRKSRRRDNPDCSRLQHTFRFTAYEDGVHPKPFLAKLWLIKITRLLHDHCYS